MAPVERPLSVQCFEYRTRLPGGLSRPLLLVARDRDGVERQIVVKLREPDGDSRSNWGATSLACELTASMLARALGLSVPDYYVARVSRDMLPGVLDPDVRKLLERNVGLNFGCAYLPGTGVWNPGKTLSADAKSALDGILSFDATILNGDRTAQKPNVLWRGGADYFLIDHSLAMKPTLPADMLMPAESVREHFAYAPLFQRESWFTAVANRWRESILPTILRDIRDAVPSDWEREPGDVNAIFSFLESRSAALDSVGEDLRRIVG